MAFRAEHDTLGEVRVPADRYWGAQTERSRHHFRIGPPGSMPLELVHALALVKKAAAQVNVEQGALDATKAALVARVCDEIAAGVHDREFPLVIWQTGSGTQTNMNVNEVIANRAHELAGGRLGDGRHTLHPNDDVNRSQSSNDVFPTAMHVALVRLVVEVTRPGVRELRDTLAAKAVAFRDVVKLGRTHLMDATPLTLGAEIGAWVSQLDAGLHALDHALEACCELAIGGTAVGTGLNAPRGFGARAAARIAELTGLPFVAAPDKFAALAAHDAIVELSGAFKRLAVSLMKIASDVRLLASGPRAGLGELRIPDNEPGSSIMPGKVNPTQCEALTMVAAQVIGNDVAISVAGSGGQLQLNVFKPMIAANALQSARLLGDACASFARHCAAGIEPDRAAIARHLAESLMLVTALTPHIGYARAAEIAKRAHAEGRRLREVALASGFVTAAQFDQWVDPAAMIGPRD